jgi:hypothetical protein
MFVAFSCRCIIFLLYWWVLLFYYASSSHQNSNLIWIQIDLQFVKDSKIKRLPYSLYRPWAEFSNFLRANPARPTLPFPVWSPAPTQHQPTLASWPSIPSDRDRLQCSTEIVPTDLPLFNSILDSTISRSFQDKSSRTPYPLWHGTKSPIYSSLFCLNFGPQRSNPSRKNSSLCVLICHRSPQLGAGRGGSLWSTQVSCRTTSWSRRGSGEAAHHREPFLATSCLG